MDFSFLKPCWASDSKSLLDIHLCSLLHINFSINFPGKGVSATGLKSEAVLGCGILGNGTIVLNFHELGKIDSFFNFTFN